ncbi:UDP-N-acetylmuramate--L-alanine ligase [Wenzhouxiangella limi]|uniref:UDP-N-acetylmuramate--L-alanine ligase n=1 Tax=Wenzhouxiangella limi TaxID=2707351 RepID=A0A845UXT8_9GAMM|nr:UDP-N-acetylmuramate--L-alanine ligase [Wenzhouxiangella limi]NDY96673.1 UDP-N-acetylmuramate--L-alanine ligase [Wenzhouxiangella limi]
MHRVRQIHLVGIGGAGMSGIAEVLVNLGFAVSGSDLAESETVQRLRRLGVVVHSGHRASHLGEADVLVVSGAVADDNEELLAARTRRIPVVARAEMLAELMRFRQGIAVAGTHGKTTTTSLLAGILAHGGLDPTFIIGGLVNAFGSHARLGEGRYLVAEADESDASFLQLQPVISVVTNIDRDHLDAYQGSFDRLQQAFLEFLHHLPFFGVAVLCIDDPHVAQLVPEVGRNVVTYGFDEAADVRASDLTQDGRSMRFLLWLPDLEAGVPVTLTQPGRHNVQNALGAAAVAWELGLGTDAITAGLAAFGGIGRRFAELGELDFGDRRVLAFEDYGHHPTELDAVLQAARAGWPQRRLVLVFQPHRFTRTRDQFDAFARVLGLVDELVLADIYPAGESPIAGIDSDALARAIGQRSELTVHRLGGIDEVPALLEQRLRDQDLLLVMGAGDVGRLGATLRAMAPGESA